MRNAHFDWRTKTTVVLSKLAVVALWADKPARVVVCEQRRLLNNRTSHNLTIATPLPYAIDRILRATAAPFVTRLGPLTAAAAGYFLQLQMKACLH